MDNSASRDKSAKFVELANKRVNKAIKDIKLVANLSNKQNYVYSEEQARKIIKALQNEVDLVKQSFMSGNEDSQSLFRL
jgi:ABC-type Fe3+-hydroxamate transport system substrate-binding protein